MEADRIQELAAKLDGALREARETKPLKTDVPELSLSEAYLIQEAGIALRLKRGEKRVGMKMGLTSKAKMEQMGISTPVYGVLTDRMQLRAGSSFSLRGSIHPKIEPEIAFVVGEEIRGEISVEEALQACSGICPAMEILDSRYAGFKYFSLEDVVADNSSSFAFVLGDRILNPSDLDFGHLQMTMKIDGQVAQKATSDAILGHPIRSLVQLCALLHSKGKTLPAGSVVLAGAATAATALKPGMSISLEVENLGEVSVKVSN